MVSVFSPIFFKISSASVIIFSINSLAVIIFLTVPAAIEWSVDFGLGDVKWHTNLMKSGLKLSASIIFRFQLSGIGLSLVSRILEIYNGKIWVEDKVKGEYSQGSKFVVLIPEADEF